MDGDDVALEARAHPERRHRDPVRVGDHQHLRDLGHRGRVDDEVGPPRRVEAEVGAVEVALGLAVSDPIVAERLAQGPRHLGQRRGHAPSASDGTLSAARPNAQRMLSCTISSARSPSCDSHAARKPW